MAAAFLAHRRDQREVDRYIALTESVATSLLESGLVAADRVTVRPNSVPDPGPLTAPGLGLLFVGRLTREKGVPLLLDAWRQAGAPFGTLTFVGDGPERLRVQAATRRDVGVRWLGQLSEREVSAALAQSAALVVPSTAPEGLPLVVLEAFSHGRPVLATSGGSLSATVDAHVGWLCSADLSALTSALREAATSNLSALGASARSRYEVRYSPAVVMAQQIDIYREVMAERHIR
jgi:glycosyltransferase involved in cell wall biosynthesis